MANFNRTTYAAFFKEHYPEQKLNTDLTLASPFLGLVEKRKAAGKYEIVPYKVAPNPGRSNTFASAQAQAAAATTYAFQVTMVPNYAVVPIDGVSLLASRGNAGAIVDLYEFATNDAMQNLKQSLAKQAWGDGNGWVGTMLTSSLTTGTVTLTNPEMAVGIEAGMVLSASATTNGALRTGGLTVLSVNYDTGVISGTVPSAWVDSDYVFPVGDAANNGAKKAPGGILGWCPSTKPTVGDSWYTVDRSANDRLAGRIFNATGLSYYEALVKAGASLMTTLSTPDYVFMSPYDFGQLALELGQNYRFENTKEAAAGVEGIKVPVGTNVVKVLPEPFCPRGTALMTQMDTWHYRYLGDTWLPDILDFDGNSSLRSANDDAYEIRIGAVGNFCCYAAYKNVRLINLGS
jgi:hypothetical protein